MTITLHRRFTFLLGLILIVVGQFIATQRQSLVRYEFMETLQPIFRFDLLNNDNALTALILFLAGLVLLALSVRAQLPVTDLPPLPRVPAAARRAIIIVSLIVGVLTAITNLQLSALDASLGPVLLWLLSLILVSGLLYWLDRQADDAAERAAPLAMTGLDWLLMIGLTALAFFVLTYQLESIPARMIPDEGIFWDKSINFIRGGNLNGLFGVGGYDFPYLTNVQQGVTMQLFGETLWAWRFSAVWPSALSVIPLYIFAREGFGRRAAILSVLAFISLPYLIAFSRIAYINSQAILPMMVSMMAFLIGYKRGSLFWMGQAGLWAGVSALTYTAARLSSIIIVAVFGLLLLGALIGMLRLRAGPWRERLARPGRVIGWGIVVGLVMLLAALPKQVYTETLLPGATTGKIWEALFPNAMYAADIYGEAEIFRDHPPIEIGDQRLFFRPDLYVDLFVRGLTRSFMGLHVPGLTVEHHVQDGLMGVMTPALYVIGLLAALKLRRAPAAGLLLLWFFVGWGLLSVVNTFPPRPTHAVSVIPAFAVLIGLGGVVLLEGLGAVFRRRVLGHVIGWGLLIGAFALNLNAYFVRMPQAIVQIPEDIIAFAVIEGDEQTRFRYLVNTREELWFVPFLVQYIPMERNYRTMVGRTLENGAVTFDASQPYTLFVPPDMNVRLERIIRQQLNAGTLTVTNHLHGDGRVKLVEYDYIPDPAQAAAGACLCPCDCVQPGAMRPIVLPSATPAPVSTPAGG